MRLPSLLTAAALATTSWALTPTTCSHDNCYRTLFPTLPRSSSAFASASSYCSSLSAAANKATITNYPTQAVSACGTTQPRYASACSCLDAAICEQADSAGGVAIRNGNFECGIAPWHVNTSQGGSWIVSDPAYDGKYAFSFTTRKQGYDMYPYIDQTITVFQNYVYDLSFYTWFSDEYAGFVGVRIDMGDTAVNSYPPNAPQTWERQNLTFASKGSSSLNIRFEFVSNPGVFTMKIDDVFLKPIGYASTS